MDSADESRDRIANWETAWEREIAARWAIARTDRVLGQIGLRRMRCPKHPRNSPTGCSPRRVP
ncbi:hypothetical protein [Sciscionella marina]|uniref:hypothetical protein n=1 Tax=Sciscionella marina TaxID=508770 RepID=UPI000363E9A5|nr:hypothetical protein [Sciscionella marina]